MIEDDMMNDGNMMADGSIIDDGSKSGDMGMDMMDMAEQDSTGALLLIELEKEHMDDMYPETILIAEEDLHMMMEQEIVDMEMMEKIESIKQIDIAMMEEMMEEMTIEDGATEETTIGIMNMMIIKAKIGAEVIIKAAAEAIKEEHRASRIKFMELVFLP